MSHSNFDHHEHDPVANLHMQPAKGILKVKSIDDSRQDIHQHESASGFLNSNPSSGMTRSESKSHKIPHFDEMNIIATYHPPDKDYGHMKIEEPKTPYAPNDLIEDEMETEDSRGPGIDPSALVEKLKESTSPNHQPIRLQVDRLSDEDGELPIEDLEHRKKFEKHRKRHYNEFEVVRLRRKEIEEELRALEQEDQSAKEGNSSRNSMSTDSIKPILIHHENSKDPSSDHHHYHHHVHVDDDHEDVQNLTPEERERKRQFEMKRKKHYDEFRAARLADKEDEDENNG